MKRQKAQVVELMKSRPILIGVFGMIRMKDGELIDLNGSAHSVQLYLDSLHDIAELVSNDPNARPSLVLEFSDEHKAVLCFDPATENLFKVED